MPIEIAGLTLAAVYEREVAASLERIWENVLDWEHLPWLHRTSFQAIHEVEAGPSGWRARVLARARARKSGPVSIP